MKIIKIIAASALLIILVLLIKQQLCKDLQCIVKMDGIKSLELKEEYENSDKSYRALFQSDLDMYRVEIRSVSEENEAEKLIRSRAALIRGLFENASSPYPGQISDVIVCPPEFKPQYSTTVNSRLNGASFLGYLNDRMQFGVCTQDQAVKKGYLVLFTCPKTRKFIQLEVIADTDKFDKNPTHYQKIIESVDCK